MTIEESRIRNFEELHSVLRPFRDDNSWVFRGHARSEWPLVPKAGRGGITINDQNLFQSWRRAAFPHLSHDHQSEWDLLALAQHHGLATRLLDWSTSPLVAAFFVVDEMLEVDGAIYAYWNNDAFDSAKRADRDQDPFNLERKGIHKIRPRYVTNRLGAQAGIFTIHDPPNLRLEQAFVEPKERLHRIIIDRSYIADLKKDLAFYGIERSVLFPDLDGLADYLNWYHSPARKNR